MTSTGTKSRGTGFIGKDWNSHEGSQIRLTAGKLYSTTYSDCTEMILHEAKFKTESFKTQEINTEG